MLEGRLEATEVPGDLQVVPDDRPIPLPAPFFVGRPIAEKALADVGNLVAGIGEVRHDQRGQFLEHLPTSFEKLWRYQPRAGGQGVKRQKHVEQVSRDVVAN